MKFYIPLGFSTVLLFSSNSYAQSVNIDDKPFYIIVKEIGDKYNCRATTEDKTLVEFKVSAKTDSKSPEYIFSNLARVTGLSVDKIESKDLTSFSLSRNKTESAWEYDYKTSVSAFKRSVARKASDHIFKEMMADIDKNNYPKEQKYLISLFSGSDWRSIADSVANGIEVDTGLLPKSTRSVDRIPYISVPEEIKNFINKKYREDFSKKLFSVPENIDLTLSLHHGDSIML